MRRAAVGLGAEGRDPVALLEGEGDAEVALEAAPDRVAGQSPQQPATLLLRGGGGLAVGELGAAVGGVPRPSGRRDRRRTAGRDGPFPRSPPPVARRSRPRRAVAGRRRATGKGVPSVVPVCCAGLVCWSAEQGVGVLRGSWCPRSGRDRRRHRAVPEVGVDLGGEVPAGSGVGPCGDVAQVELDGVPLEGGPVLGAGVDRRAQPVQARELCAFGSPWPRPCSWARTKGHPSTPPEPGAPPTSDDPSPTGRRTVAAGTRLRLMRGTGAGRDHRRQVDPGTGRPARPGRPPGPGRCQHRLLCAVHRPGRRRHRDRGTGRRRRLRGLGRLLPRQAAAGARPVPAARPRHDGRQCLHGPVDPRIRPTVALSRRRGGRPPRSRGCRARPVRASRPSSRCSPGRRSPPAR